MEKVYIYIHCGNPSEFLEYKAQNPDKECIMILDSNTLRGRTPGKIIRLGSYYDKWNAQEIEESIAIYEAQWKSELEQIDLTESIDDKNILDYGVE